MSKRKTGCSPTTLSSSDTAPTPLSHSNGTGASSTATLNVDSFHSGAADNSQIDPSEAASIDAAIVAATLMQGSFSRE